MTKSLRLLLIAVFFLLAPPALSQAGELYTDDGRLKDLEHVKAYFDVTAEDPRTLLFRLDLLERTIRQLTESGIEVTTVIGFRGAASRYITIEDYYILEDEIGPKQKIQERVKALLASDLRIEQCRIAAELHDIDPGDFLRGIQLVENGYVSLIGYQSRGYTVVPLD